MKTKPLPTIKDLRRLVIALKPSIEDDYRGSSYFNEGPDFRDETSTMDLTIGWDPDSGDWSYQTGDNSYTGSAYFYPVWAVTEIWRRCNSTEVARDLQNQLAEQSWYWEPRT